MLSFRRIEIPRDNETIIKFRRNSYTISFGNESLFGSNNSYIKKILERLKKYPDGLVIVEMDGKPVGQIELQIKQFENEDVGYVNLFYLIAEYRGQGYGAKLIEYAEDFFRKNYVNLYQLRVSPTNISAISFYKKHGFEILRVEEEDTVPRYRMQKLLS